MSNQDFEIKNGMLIKYHGNDEKVVIPNGVTVIGSRAFEKNDTLKEIFIPKSVREIYGADWEHIDIYEDTTIGGAFYQCKKLENIIFEENSQLEKIDSFSFYRCRKLKEIRLPNSLKKLEDFSFIESSMKKIVLSNQMTEIGYATFKKCTIKQITIPKNIKSIKGKAFRNSNIGELIIEEGLEKICAEAFKRCKCKKIAIPRGIKKIEKAFNESIFQNIDIADDYFSNGCLLDNISKTNLLEIATIGLSIDDILYIFLNGTPTMIKTMVSKMGTRTDLDIISQQVYTALISNKITKTILKNSAEFYSKYYDIISKNILKKVYALYLEKKSDKAIEILLNNMIFPKIKNDDISIMDYINLMDFPLKDIDNFCSMAIENKSMMCIAELLNYKNSHFGFTPQDFSL